MARCLTNRKLLMFCSANARWKSFSSVEESADVQATEYHLGQLKAKLAKLRTQLQEPPKVKPVQLRKTGNIWLS